MGIATRKMRSIGRTLIASVTGILSPIFSETCFPSREKLCPKSRVAIRPSHRTYCTWIGWARPEYARSLSPPPPLRRDLGVQVRGHLHRPAGGRVDDEEGDEADPDQERDCEHQAAGDIAEHPSPIAGRWCTSAGPWARTT